MTVESPDPFSWWLNEPERLERDQHEMHLHFPEMLWNASDSGTWRGTLPTWPFDRALPTGVDTLQLDGLEILVRCGEAYPIVAPALFPVDPEPGVDERTQHRWHVNGDGSLCLFQDESIWSGRQSLTDLLYKAAGWNIEYKLMTVGVIDTMTVTGIAANSELDHLVADVLGVSSELPPS